LTTVYPTAATITITSGSTGTTIIPETAGLTVAPSVLPGYAKAACTPTGVASARFASACSCAGVSASTSTATQATATVVVPTGSAPCQDPVSQERYVFGDTSKCNANSNDGGSCLCFQTSSGVNACTPNFYCSQQATCSAAADCQTGEVCVVDSFCGVGKCASINGCLNNVAPARIFRLRRRSEPASGAFPDNDNKKRDSEDTGAFPGSN
jgi:hypothetical protein